MTYLSFLVLFLFLIISQFYTLFFVEIGLLFFLPALLLLPTGITILRNIFLAESRMVGFIQIMKYIIRIIFAQSIYLLCIYLFIVMNKGYSLFADWGFWITYFQSYHVGAAYWFLQDLIAGFSNNAILLILIPSFISSSTLAWIYYWLKQCMKFIKGKLSPY